MNFKRTTEESSLYDNLEDMSVEEILTHINNEDKKVAVAVEEAMPQIAPLVEKVVEKLSDGGRLFYIGAGTSGRLGILDASEIPPTFGMPDTVVIGLIAGGDKAIRTPVENAEDSENAGWNQLQQYNISDKDIVVGIAASGTTPYVISTLRKCRENGIATGSISCNSNAPVSAEADFPIEIIVGPEFITGSTRMKSGTAQKLVLNMISTTSMVALGRVKGNKMVNMQLTNRKLIERGCNMITDITGIDYAEARKLLVLHGSVSKVIEVINQRKRDNMQ
ncbi:MAG: N-acetylmuramic acid 6-phosphate etherase [Tannerellaceae bacterium]